MPDEKKVKLNEDGFEAGAILSDADLLKIRKKEAERQTLKEQEAKAAAEAEATEFAEFKAAKAAEAAKKAE